MQTIPGYPTANDSLEPVFEVRVNGAVVEAEEVSISRGLAFQVNGGGSIMAATGSVDWAAGEDSRKRNAHPWSPQAFPPRKGDAVTVDMGYGSTLVRKFTGGINNTEGSLVAGDVSSELIDDTGKLNTPISQNAVLATIAPVDEGGDYRYCAITPTSRLDRFLREAGFYATPPHEPGCVMAAPLMGSSYPEVGRVTSSQNALSLGSPSWWGVEWGQAAYSLQATYDPWFTNADGKLNKTLQLTLMLGADTGGTGTAQAAMFWGGDRLRLATAGDAIIAQRTVGEATTELCRLAITANTVYTLRITAAGACTLRSSKGAQSAGTLNITNAMATTALTNVTVLAGHEAKYPMGGVQVSFHDQWTALNYTRTAHLGVSAHRFSLDWTPALEREPVLDLVTGMAAAECAAIRLDEFGHFRFTNRNDLTGAAPTLTLTSLDHFEELDWEYNHDSLKSKVVVKGIYAEISRSRWDNITFYQGNGDTLTPGEERVEIISVPADEDWIGPDNENLNETLERFYASRGTWAGSYRENADKSITEGGVASTLVNLGARTWKWTHVAADTPTNASFVLKFNPDRTDFPKHLRGANSPFFRGRNKVTRVDHEVVGAARGPAALPAHEHDVAWFVQDRTAMQELADWMAARLTTPTPSIRSIRIIPDHRIQLGDVVWITDEATTGVRLKALVLAETITHRVGEAEQSLECLVLSWDLPWATLTDHDAVWSLPGDTLTTHDTALAGKTLTQHDAAPLERS